MTKLAAIPRAAAHQAVQEQNDCVKEAEALPGLKLELFVCVCVVFCHYWSGVDVCVQLVAH